MYRTEKINAKYTDKIDSKNRPIATEAKIEYGDGEVFLKTNGEIAAIDIKYEGAFKGVNTLGDGWLYKCNNNRIIIASLAQSQFKERIFNYIGNIKIKSAEFATWDGKKIRIQIQSKEQTTWANSFKDKTIHKEITKSRI